MGISAGAFGAHALSKRLGDKSVTWSLASNYAILNGIALLAISQHPVHSRRYGPACILGGTILFSGSIFALLLFRDQFVASPLFPLQAGQELMEIVFNRTSKIAGPATPIGGLLMIGGYLSLLL